MKKKTLCMLLFMGVCPSLMFAAIFNSTNQKTINALSLSNARWVHYTATNPTHTKYGTNEYWIECGGDYQFSEPVAVSIEEGGNSPNTSEFSIDDSRWNKDLIPYSFDVDDINSVVGAKAYNATSEEDQTWWGTNYACLTVLSPTSLKYKEYDSKNFIEYLPRVNFKHYAEVYMDVTMNIWKSNSSEGVRIAFDNSSFSGGDLLIPQTNTGYISLESHGDYVDATFFFAGNTIAYKRITDENVLNGDASVCIYVAGVGSGDFYLTINNFAAHTGHVHAWDDWVSDLESTYTTHGSRHHTCKICGETAYDELPLLTYEAGYLDNNINCGDNVIQLVLPDDFPLNDGQYGVNDGNVVSIKHDGIVYNLNNASDDTISVVTNGNERYLQFNYGRLGYHTIGSWNPGTDLLEGDSVIIEGDFTGLSGNCLGQSFNVSKTVLYCLKTSSTTIHYYKYIEATSLLTSEDCWLTNTGFQFYAEANGISKYSDVSPQVGKYRTLTADAVTLYRNGISYNIGKNNDGWYDGILKDNPTRYFLKLTSGSLDVSAVAGSIQNNDVVTIDGLFYSPVTNDKVYIKTPSMQFVNTGSGTYGWAQRQYSGNRTSKLNIGVWNGSYHFTDDQQLIDIAEQGINVIIGVNPYWMSSSTWSHILNLADSLHIKFIVDPRNYNSGTGSYDAWDGTCPSYASHNAVMGFDIWDEPSTTNFDQLQSLKAQFDAVMPEGKLFFVNLMSSMCGLSSLYGTSTGKTLSSSYYETNYASYFDSTVDPDIYSWDSYPLFTNGCIRRSYFCDFDIWSYLGKQNGIPLWFTLLAAGHNSGDGLTYITPTAKEFRWQMSVAMTYGISNLMNYVYTTTDNTYTSLANMSGGDIVSYNSSFTDMGTVNNEFRRWEDIYLNYEWQGTGTYHTGSTNYLFSDLRHNVNLNNYGLSSESASTDLLIGAFKDNTDKYAYMVTNSGYSHAYSYKYSANVSYSNDATSVTLNFAYNISGITIIQNGEATYEVVDDTSYTFNLPSYGSAFVIPNY